MKNLLEVENWAKLPQMTVPNQLAAPPHSGVPSQTGDAGLVNDIATKVMEQISQQNLLSRYYPPLPAWPPAPPR